MNLIVIYFLAASPCHAAMLCLFLCLPTAVRLIVFVKIWHHTYHQVDCVLFICCKEIFIFKLIFVCFFAEASGRLKVFCLHSHASAIITTGWLLLLLIFPFAVAMSPHGSTIAVAVAASAKLPINLTIQKCPAHLTLISSCPTGWFSMHACHTFLDARIGGSTRCNATQHLPIHTVNMQLTLHTHSGCNRRQLGKRQFPMQCYTTLTMLHTPFKCKERWQCNEGGGRAMSCDTSHHQCWYTCVYSSIIHTLWSWQLDGSKKKWKIVSHCNQKIFKGWQCGNFPM